MFSYNLRCLLKTRKVDVKPTVRDLGEVKTLKYDL